MDLVAYFQQEMSVFQHRIRRLAMPDKDTFKTQL